MKLIIGGESGWEYFERWAYDGVIGLFYKTTFQGLLAYLIFGIMITLSLIGLYTVIKWIINKRKKKKNTYKY